MQAIVPYGDTKPKTKSLQWLAYGLYPREAVKIALN